MIIVGIFATVLALPQTLAKLPLQNLLKNELHVDRTANAAFFFWTTLPWYFKPFAGILTDSVPLFGSRRKSYIMVGALFGVLAWVGLYFTPHDYNRLLCACFAISLFTVIASAGIGGYMVETAQASSASGRLTAIRTSVEQLCAVIYGPGGGYLAGIALGWTALACGGTLFLIVPATIFFLHEQHKSFPARNLTNNAVKQLGKIGSAKTMWAAAGLMALFYMAPGVTTAVFYKQQNDLHLDTQAQGTLQFISGICGILAAIVYGYACRRLNLRTLLVVCLSMATAANFVFLFYTSPANARLIEGFNGFGYTLAELVMMDLAVRATPAGSEGLGFSLMMSVRNFALYGTDWLGSAALDQYHLPFDALVAANCATTLLTVPLALLLPGNFVRKRDAERDETAAAPRGLLQD